MPKRVALKDSFLVDTSDLSNFARAVNADFSDEQVDVSGFSATGVNEYLPGPRTQTVTVTFYGAYGTGETHAVLYPLYKNRTTTVIKWRADQTQPVSATNPELRGNAKLFSYGPGATRGDTDTYDVTFTAFDAAGFDWFTT
jgi:hypothetical protein